jgi:hypothetical protein
MIRTPGAPFTRLSAGVFATLAILFIFVALAASPAYAQASRCSASGQSACYYALVLFCEPANRVCGYELSGVSVCECRPECTNSQSCAANSACFRGNCNSNVPCNSDLNCRVAGIADAVCSDGLCVKGPPPVPPGCTADPAQCQATNACNGAGSCDAASRSCVTGPPVSCPQPGPIIVRAPDGSFAFVGQHAHCEPVPMSTTETTCVTTTDPLPPPPLCKADPVDNPNLVFTPTGVDLVPFKYTATLRDRSYTAGAKPQVVYVRLSNARGADAMLATTAPAGKPDGSDWQFDKKDAAWHWTRNAAASPIESVTLKSLGGQRVRVQVIGAAKAIDGSFTPARTPPVPPSPQSGIFAIETGITWAGGSERPQRLQPPCTVVVDDCQRSANGGLNCHVPGWKPGGKD